MANDVRIDGLRELDAALAEFSKQTAAGTLRRAGIKALAPFIARARQLVPRATGALHDSLAISTRLSKRQAARHRRMRAAQGDAKAFVELFAGPAALPHAHLTEFGTARTAPQPFLRPAWDATRAQVLDGVRRELAAAIAATAARLARRRARGTAGRTR